MQPKTRTRKEIQLDRADKLERILRGVHSVLGDMLLLNDLNLELKANHVEREVLWLQMFQEGLGKELKQVNFELSVKPIPMEAMYIARDLGDENEIK